MRTVRMYYSLFLILSLSLINLSCSKGTSGDNNHDFPKPIPASAVNITLDIYSDGWGNLLATIEVASEGDVTIDIVEANPYSDPPAYYIYATSSGFYTELYKCTKGETITIDLDKVPDMTNSLTGVIFSRQSFFADCYHANQPINITQQGTGDNLFSGRVTTDEQGRWGIGNIPLGDYLISFDQLSGIQATFIVTNTASTDYEDLFYLEGIVVYAPNLYLYPEIETDVTVVLDIPSGGHVTISEPEYGDGWNVRVSPDGIINNDYYYLFYEADVVMPLQSKVGWMLDGTDLENEFRRLLESLGFIGREIDDFVEYWVPKVEGKPWCVIYPQDAEAMSILNITPAPDKIMRALFVIRPLDQPIPVTNPVITPFVRDGFTVVEWGVTGWEE